ncbi:MAG: hypothetical protein VXV95_03820 [Candidatus Thermoplasmatota archaeon]|nr:hypothetical protein [Candidatus Thermoplasmatota archaeon]
MNKITIAGLKFQMVKAGSVFIGEDRGGWIYSGQRPKHEVRCPDFYIMAAPMTLPELANILEAKLAPEDETTWNKERLTAILAIVNQTLIDSNVDLDSSLDWEIRCPTQGEWLHAKNTKKIEVECGMKEVLADAVAPNYRGAMMDGRPRQFDGHGPMQWHTATMEIHPNKASIHALSSAPMDRDNIGLSVRLVLTPIRKGDPKTVPKKADYGANIRSELLWTTVLGVIPSFAIPWLRGLGDYVYSGWVNLLFGGLCVGFVTGAIWRPRRPIITYEQGE